MTLSFRGTGIILDILILKIVLKQTGCDWQPSYFPLGFAFVLVELLPSKSANSACSDFFAAIPKPLNSTVTALVVFFSGFPLTSQICNLYTCFMKIQSYSRKRVMYSLEQEDHVRGELSYMSCLDMMNGCLPSSSQSFPWPS